jgi:hypothetical protein
MLGAAFVAVNFVYAFVVYQALRSPTVKGQAVFDEKLPLYLSIAGIFLLLLIKPIRDRLWEINRSSIKTADMFYRSLIIVTVVSMAIAESIGVFGLIFSFMTGKLIFSESLLTIAFIGTVIYFPRDSWIESKMRDCGSAFKGYEAK